MRDYWIQSNANPARRRAALERKIPQDRSGCWPWRGGMTPAGYGIMRTGPKATGYVHRVSYEMYVGPIPDGMQIDHLCRNRACFNPAHLEAVSPGENFRRGIHRGAIAHKTNICLKGLHELTPENTYPSGTGRRCRECNLEWQRQRRRVNRKS